jgi:uncharacterized protein
MSAELLRASDRVAKTWKNGGGLTWDLAVWPPGAGLDDFEWRVSMATVSEAGPFSIFPDVDRILAVLEGRVRLTVDDRPSVTLNEETAPYAFPGDAPSHAAPMQGPAVDLNVMTRRGFFAATMERTADSEIFLPAAATLLVAPDPAKVWVGPIVYQLARHDALTLHATHRRQATIRGALWVVRLRNLRAAATR